MASPLGTPPKGGEKAPPQSSAQMDTATHSGSRPGSVRFPIESSAPTDAWKLDGRGDVPGFLGSGSESRRKD